MPTDVWEYKTIKFNSKGFLGGVVDIPTFGAALNDLGAQGWELVSVFDTNTIDDDATQEIVATLKRRRY